ncbi:cuticle protein 10.9-like [Ornithodoros turicata]|uniref:cuticle protein 10.9-like n=1 Tax=Ornithodoros turicata TaxID=34597 RepID=UPI00313A349F
MYAKVLLVTLIAVAAAQVPEDPPQPYSFSFDSTDEFGTRLLQSESGDEGNRKTGSYGYQSADGTYRHVNYVADENGFRATVDTNEPGTKAESPADVQLNANPQPNPVGAPVAAPVVSHQVAQAVHVVAAQPVAHAIHAVPVSFAQAPVAYRFGRASSR